MYAELVKVIKQYNCQKMDVVVQWFTFNSCIQQVGSLNFSQIVSWVLKYSIKE